MNVRTKFEVRSSIEVLGGGCEHQSWGTGGRRGRYGTIRKSVSEFLGYRLSIINFPLSLRVSESQRYCRFCAPTRHFFLPHLYRVAQKMEKICNNTITKDPTTPQVCRYTCEMSDS